MEGKGKKSIISDSFNVHAINNNHFSFYIPFEEVDGYLRFFPSYIHTNIAYFKCVLVYYSFSLSRFFSFAHSLCMQRKFTCFNIIAPGFIDIRRGFGLSVTHVSLAFSSYLRSRSFYVVVYKQNMYVFISEASVSHR